MIRIVAQYVLLEAVRRKTFAVVGMIAGGLFFLYSWGAWMAFRAVEDGFSLRGLPVDGQQFVGNQLTGVTIFGELFLGSILAVLLSQAAIRGDAEIGLLQPIVARPVGRFQYLLTRFFVVAAVVAISVMAAHFIIWFATGLVGGFWAPQPVLAAIYIGLAVAVVTGITVLMSVFLGLTANGITVFMLFGAGIALGMMIDVGSTATSFNAAREPSTLEVLASYLTWLLPFEPLYQGAVYHSSIEATGAFSVLNLGPFTGGREPSALLVPWVIAFCAALMAVAGSSFNKRDL